MRIAAEPVLLIARVIIIPAPSSIELDVPETTPGS